MIPKRQSQLNQRGFSERSLENVAPAAARRTTIDDITKISIASARL
jgi:hypothetical protein